MKVSTGVIAVILSSVGVSKAAVDYPYVCESSDSMKVNGAVLVGGTGTPGRLLDVRKSVTTGTDADIPTVRALNTSDTQGNGSGTYNFAILDATAGNGNVVTTFLSSYDNGSTFGSAGHVRVYTNHPLHFWTNNTKQMTITSGGNVGIGTTNPTSRMVINDSTYSSNMTINDRSTRGPGLNFQKNGTNIGMIGTTGKIVGSTEEYLGLFAESNLGIRFYTNGSTSEKLTITTDGNIGIGTTSPTSKLHVSGGAVKTDTIKIARPYSGNTFDVYAGTNTLYLGPSISCSPNMSHTYISGNLDVTGSIESSDGLSISGNITSSDTVVCEVLKINNWKIEAPDYVFEKDYKVRNLEEVEKFVTEHKHLPDVPSAKEMTAKGVDLAEMNMTLLKKVEELTIYAINQNKKMDAQQKEIEAMKAEMKRMH